MDQLKPNITVSSPLTPLSFLERASIVYDECASIVHNSTVYTWSETYARCRRLASSISAIVSGGGVVSVVAPNIPATYELQFAVPMAGAVLNNINTRLDARTISVLLSHGESKLVFVDFQFYDLVLESISLLPRNFTPPLLVLIEDEVKNSWGKVDGNHSKIHDTYEGMVEKGDPRFEWIRPERETDPMTLNYTSGTTSSPKGVVHSHRSIFVVTFDSLIGWFMPERPVYLWTLPMFHSNGWTFTWGMAAVGGTNICLRKIDPNIVFSAISNHKVTHMCGAPVVLNMLANSPHARKLNRPVHFLTGGAPPPPAVVLRVESLGFVVSHGYGMTEVAGVVVSCAWKPEWNDFPAAARAQLKARQGVRTLTTAAVDVVDDSGRSVARDGSMLGEIVLRGECVMLGYLKNPEATEKCLKNGWLYTGDVGVIHGDGYLEVKDRSKDIIISGGENVSSVEVESVLYSHPAVDEAAVVARPDDFWGETPCAFLSLCNSKDDKSNSNNRLSVKEMMEFCRERLPHYMVPKTVVFMAELPKTSTGKIQKFELRKIAKKMGTLTIGRL